MLRKSRLCSKILRLTSTIKVKRYFISLSWQLTSFLNVISSQYSLASLVCTRHAKLEIWRSFSCWSTPRPISTSRTTWVLCLYYSTILLQSLTFCVDNFWIFCGACVKPSFQLDFKRWQTDVLFLSPHRKRRPRCSMCADRALCPWPPCYWAPEPRCACQITWVLRFGASGGVLFVAVIGLLVAFLGCMVFQCQRSKLGCVSLIFTDFSFSSSLHRSSACLCTSPRSTAALTWCSCWSTGARTWTSQTRWESDCVLLLFCFVCELFMVVILARGRCLSGHP